MNEILKKAMEDVGIRPIDIARKAGITPSAMYRKLRSSMSDEEQLYYVGIIKSTDDNTLGYMACKECNKYYSKRACMYLYCPICGKKMIPISTKEARELKRSKEATETAENIKNYVDRLCEIIDYGEVSMCDIKINGMTLEELVRFDA